MSRLLWAALLAAGFAAQEPVPPAARPQQPPPSTGPVPKPPVGVPGDLGPQELARAMTETLRLSVPGEPHKRLGRLVGEFDVELLLTLPGSEPERSVGSARAGLVLGGRYLVLELDVPMRGVPLEGLYIFGYDRLRSLWSASWRDSLSTWSIEAFGTADQDDQDLLRLLGLMFDVASPNGREFRIDFALTSADRFAIAVFDSVQGQQVKVMEQRFIRRPAQRPR